MINILTIILLTLIPLTSSISVAQEIDIFSEKEISIDVIDPSYTGKWGWHKIHKKTVMKAQTEPYVPDKAICSKCHKNNEYKIFNPHVQLNHLGSVIKEKCLYCHKSKPDVNMASFSEVELIDDLKIICQRCHGSFSNHPANISHFVRPSEKMYKKMLEIQIYNNIILPLDYEGKLTCITCHNPHERGVIPDYRSSAKGAGSKHRHRLPEILCKSCHDM